MKSIQPTYEELKPLDVILGMGYYYQGIQPTYEELKPQSLHRAAQEFLGVSSLPMRN